MHDIDISTILASGLSVSTVLLIMLVANLRGLWYSSGAVERLVQSYKDTIEYKDDQLRIEREDRDFYRNLTFRTTSNQDRIASIVEQAVTKPSDAP